MHIHQRLLFLGHRQERFYKKLAGKLEIQADCDGSAAEFVQMCVEDCFNEMRAEDLEKEAATLRGKN